MTYSPLTTEELRNLKREIYIEKEVNKLTYTQIGEIYKIPASEIKELYNHIRKLNSDGKYDWLDGLSNRAINQLKKTQYTDFDSLYTDVIIKDIDLEDQYWIGKKVSREIRLWCKKQAKEKQCQLKS